jgi:hypothetical protein
MDSWIVGERRGPGGGPAGLMDYWIAGLMGEASLANLLSVSRDEDFQYARLGQTIAGGNFFDGIGQLPAEAKGH